MIWIEFIVNSALVVIAAVKLAEYGDIIALRTGLGRAFIGVILMASAGEKIHYDTFLRLEGTGF